MRVVVFYRSASESGRRVEEFIHDFERQTGRALETADPDSRDGSTLAATYDVVEYPTILAFDNDGRELARWRGDLPTINEVSYYNA